MDRPFMMQHNAIVLFLIVVTVSRCMPEAAATNVRCQIDVQSYGYTDCSCNFGQTAFVFINGVTIWMHPCCETEARARGVNILVINPISCTVTSIANFDTWINSSNAVRLANTLNRYASTTVVVGVTADSPTASYPKTMSPALDALASYGVDVDDVGWRGNFAFVAQTGFSGKTVMAKSPTNSAATSEVRVLLGGTSGSGLTITRN